MLFILVIFSTYEFSQESLANVKSTLTIFIFKNSVVLNTVILKVTPLKDNGLSKVKNIFLLKELIFTSPQLKITLFKTVFLQLALICFVDSILGSGNKKSQLIKRKANVSTY
tara:strand:- start:15995 stop:16330 length:336 start_codon:yes stop_codon:yes gene_type:complete